MPRVSSQDEYRRRINRAQDYIEARLGETLTLEEVARAACFSPYHFHRIYTALTGEPLYRFILRVRLERAASQLVHTPAKSITEIALDLGFSSSATFARAFKASFGMSASAYRAANDERLGDRKDRKTIGKDRQARPSPDPYSPHVDPNTRRIEMTTIEATSIEVKTLPAKTLAYLRYVGPYAGDAELFGRLWGKFAAWAGPRGLMGAPGSEMICIYHDDPGITDDEKLRTSLGVTVAPGTETSGEINLLEIPAGQYVCARFELDPSLYAAAWNTVVGAWLPKSGYQPAELPAYECYLSPPGEDGKHWVEIRMGVKPL